MELSTILDQTGVNNRYQAKILNTTHIPYPTPYHRTFADYRTHPRLVTTDIYTLGPNQLAETPGGTPL